MIGVYCPHCGKKISNGNKYCPYCGYQLTKAMDSSTKDIGHIQTLNKSYLSELINAPFMARLTTGIPLGWLISILPGMILGFAFAGLTSINPYLMESQGLSDFLGLIGLIFYVFLFWFCISRAGLRIIDRWITPKYYHHLVKRYPNYTLNQINALGIKHLMTLANILRFLLYVAIAIGIIYLIVMALLWVLIIGAILFVISIFIGPTWHFRTKGFFFPTHWY